MTYQPHRDYWKLDQIAGAEDNAKRHCRHDIYGGGKSPPDAGRATGRRFLPGDRMAGLG
jgi:hypothetical protein